MVSSITLAAEHVIGELLRSQSVRRAFQFFDQRAAEITDEHARICSIPAPPFGERVGNTPMDQLLVNLKLMGWIDNDLSRLGEYCNVAAQSCGWTIPYNYPVFGRDAFRTATGVHAAAVIKSYRKGDPALADMVYSGVPAHLFGLKQKIEIGPMSGKSNVIFWLETHGLQADEERVSRIYERAKQATGVLEEDEIMQLV